MFLKNDLDSLFEPLSILRTIYIFIIDIKIYDRDCINFFYLKILWWMVLYFIFY